MDKPLLLVHGMHGLGDNLHQRALLRQLMQTHTVWLESSWVSVYHDLIEEGLHVIRKPSGLRTQAKNSEREAGRFEQAPRAFSATLTVSYGTRHLREARTVLEAMYLGTAIKGYEQADYRLPVPEAWYEPVDRMIASWQTDKPILIYRPLVTRPEWQGSGLRNADPNAYAALLGAIRDSFFVVSIADLAPGKEWQVGPQLIPDRKFHAGELPFESLAALFSRAGLIFTSGGFSVVLAPAVSTPVISIVGGYESAAWGATAARFAPYLGIGPMHPCTCASSACQRRCDKTIDVCRALDDVRAFVTKLEIAPPHTVRPLAEMFQPGLEPIATMAVPHSFVRRAAISQHVGVKA